MAYSVHSLTRDLDTIDLQDHKSPSAQDHSSARDDMSASPRASLDHFDGGDQNHHIDIVYDETDDSMADLKGEDGDIGDEESDDMMDDDMMDKISSSPSIDDGKPACAWNMHSTNV